MGCRRKRRKRDTLFGSGNRRKNKIMVHGSARGQKQVSGPAMKMLKNDDAISTVSFLFRKRKLELLARNRWTHSKYLEAAMMGRLIRFIKNDVIWKYVHRDE